jgi:hypothetical protein
MRRRLCVGAVMALTTLPPVKNAAIIGARSTIKF